jgi:hypothetical protein
MKDDSGGSWKSELLGFHLEDFAFISRIPGVKKMETTLQMGDTHAMCPRRMGCLPAMSEIEVLDEGQTRSSSQLSRGGGIYNL